MVNKFEVGKMYRYTGTKVENTWDGDGAMAHWLDNKPRKCYHAKLNKDADATIFSYQLRFDGILDLGWGWYYTFDDMLNFELVD